MMWPKLLSMIMGLVLIFGLITGKPLDCGDGEAYWCQNNRTAKQCKKEDHCNTIWFPSTPPAVNIVLLTEPPREHLSWFSETEDKEKMSYQTS